ncbi:hypothetical protein K438DRAFT_1779741 [Mycena galopus ATCC 62051]|nr:hypothetical protein K438DRAFT_1779741 [Mycena galopus ATCC 62051]
MAGTRKAVFGVPALSGIGHSITSTPSTGAIFGVRGREYLPFNGAHTHSGRLARLAGSQSVKTWLWDSNAVFTQILSNPTEYGFVDAVSFGNTGDFWGNNFHPGQAANQICAQDIAKLMAASTWF